MLKFIKNLTSLFRGKPEALKNGALDQTISLILNRRSCRSFNSETVSTKDMQTILDAGRFAPSTVNLQTWCFITFSRQEWLETFSRPIPFKGSDAIIVCADSYRLKNHFADFDETPFINISFAVFNAGLAAMNMTIAAEALGIKSIMLSETGKTGLLDFTLLKEKLNLPDKVLPLTTLVLGKSSKNLPGIPPRQPLSCVVMKKTYDHSACNNLKDWFKQMFIGFKLTHPLSSFDKQIKLYRKKMLNAESSIKKQYL